MTPDEWQDVLQYAAQHRAEVLLGVVNRDGVWWYRAPIPRRWHRCSPWTRSYDVERCACGALRKTGTWWWVDRNSRRRKGRL